MIGIVLAGGKSRRFGSPKWQACYEDISFEERARQTLVTTTTSQWSVVPAGQSMTSYQLEDDMEWRGMGPLAGIVTVMRHVPAEWYAICACDTPLLPSPVYERLVIERENQPVVAYADNRIHPLIALYPRSILSQFEAALRRGERAVMPHLTEATIVSFAERDWFKNVNTPSDYEELIGKEVE